MTKKEPSFVDAKRWLANRAKQNVSTFHSGAMTQWECDCIDIALEHGWVDLTVGRFGEEYFGLSPQGLALREHCSKHDDCLESDGLGRICFEQQRQTIERKFATLKPIDEPLLPVEIRAAGIREIVSPYAAHAALVEPLVEPAELPESP